MRGVGDVSVVEAYLRDLGGELRGPRRVKAGLLREAADHLDDATEAYLRAGLDPDRARARAVADFGSVAEIAPAFQTTLAVAASRRTAWTFFAGTLPQPFLWDSGLEISRRLHAEDPHTPVFAVLDFLVEGVGLVVMLGVVLAIAATGIGNRWIHAGRGIARFTAIGSLVCATVIPATGLTMILLSPGAALPLFAVAVALLVGPMLLVAASARRCLGAATALPEGTALQERRTA